MNAITINPTTTGKAEAFEAFLNRQSFFSPRWQSNGNKVTSNGKTYATRIKGQVHIYMGGTGPK